MNNDVLAVAVSPDAKYVAVALLDNTVKVTIDFPYSFFIFVVFFYFVLMVSYLRDLL